MLTLITAALLAAQPASVADVHAQHAKPQQGSGMMQHQQHEKMMMDCCKECCEHMKAHEGDMSKDHPAPKGGA